MRCVLTLSILPFSTTQPSNAPPKYLRLNTRFIKKFGTKTPYTIWCVEIKLDIQARFPYSPPHKKEALINSTQPTSLTYKPDSLILLLTKRKLLSTNQLNSIAEFQDRTELSASERERFALFQKKIAVINVGLNLFSEDLHLIGCPVVQVNWQPPRQLDPETKRLLDKLR